MIASTRLKKSEISAFLALQVFKLSSRNILFRKKKDNRNC